MVKKIFCFVCLITSVASINAMDKTLDEYFEAPNKYIELSEKCEKKRQELLKYNKESTDSKKIKAYKLRDGAMELHLMRTQLKDFEKRMFQKRMRRPVALCALTSGVVLGVGAVSPFFRRNRLPKPSFIEIEFEKLREIYKLLPQVSFKFPMDEKEIKAKTLGEKTLFNRFGENSTVAYADLQIKVTAYSSLFIMLKSKISEHEKRMKELN